MVRRDGPEVPCDAVLVFVPPGRRGTLAEGFRLELTDEGFVAARELLLGRTG